MKESNDSILQPNAALPENAQSKSSRAIDRVTLGPPESAKVVEWLKQLGGASKGFLELTKSELVNFLIRGHPADLSSRQLKAIRANHYDPVRHINWIAPRLKEALANSDIALVAALQHEIRSIEVSVISNATHLESTGGVLVTKRSRAKRKPKDKIEDLATLSLKEILNNS